jgi:hypothetical protein
LRKGGSSELHADDDDVDADDSDSRYLSVDISPDADGDAAGCCTDKLDGALLTHCGSVTNNRKTKKNFEICFSSSAVTTLLVESL